MSAHRYWRLFIHSTLSSTQVALARLELATTPSGPSQCVNGVPSASNSSSSYPVENAFSPSSDSSLAWNSTSGFSNNPATLNYAGFAYIQYDFITPKDIVEMRIKAYNSAAWSDTSRLPNAFSLYHSDDGIRWVRVKSWSNQVFSLDEKKVYSTEPYAYGQYANRITKPVFAYTLGASKITVNSIVRRGGIMSNGKQVGRTRMTPYSGTKKVLGTTTSIGKPISRRVDLIDQKSGLLVKTMLTKDDGLFEFNNLADSIYTVLGVDISGEQNSVVFSNITPVD